MDTKKIYTEPTLLDLGSVTEQTLGEEPPMEGEPISFLRVNLDM